MNLRAMSILFILPVLLLGCFPRPQATLPLDYPITLVNTMDPHPYTPVELPPTWTPGPTPSITPWPDLTSTRTPTPSSTPTPTQPVDIIIGEELVIKEIPDLLTSLVYVRKDAGRLNLNQLRPGSLDPRRLLLEDEDIISPLWSPDGTQLAYLRTADYGLYLEREAPADLYLYIAGIQTPLDHPEGMFITDLVWSPDSSMIAFTGQEGPGPEDINPGRNIYQLNIYSQRTTRVIESAMSPFGCSSPAWRADSMELAARCRGGNIIVLAIAKRDGSDPWFIDILLDRVYWSPSGERLLLIGGHEQLITIDASYLVGREDEGNRNWHALSEELRPLGLQQKRVIGFGWCPLSDQRFLVQFEDLIQIIDLEEGRTLSILGDFSELEGQFSWGPRGNQVAFAFQDGQDSEIGMVDFLQGRFFQLTDNQVDDLMPSWQPETR
jgi:hypothetical protein